MPVDFDYMEEFFGKALDLAIANPAAVAVIAGLLAVIALVWAIVSSSYRYR